MGEGGNGRLFPHSSILPFFFLVIVAIDGPAGSGKSTIGKRLANKLGYLHISTGALYRAIGWKADQQGIPLTDVSRLIDMMKKTDLDMKRGEDGSYRVYVDGMEVTSILYFQRVGNLASAVSTVPEVRENLIPLQRNLATKRDIVLDGRDIGTVIFPEAEIKFYLDASPEERARRRWLELQSKGIAADLDQLTEEVKQRDHQDITRAVAPLKRAKDAIYIDSTELSIEQVVEKMLEEIKKIVIRSQKSEVGSQKEELLDSGF
jgi:cytidylate kinase